MASATVTRNADTRNPEGLQSPGFASPPSTRPSSDTATAEDRRARTALRACAGLSPLLRRIPLVNAPPLVMLVAVLLYLDQHQTGLLQAEVLVLREEAKIYAGALGESAVRLSTSDSPRIDPDIAHRCCIG